MRHEIARHVLIRQACFGLLRHGDRAEAESLLMEALAVFRRFALYPQALVCVEQLGQSAAWEGRFDEAKRWISESASLAPRIREFIARAVEASLSTILAFEMWDPSILPRNSSTEGYSRAHHRLRRLHQQTISSRVARSLLLGEAISNDTVDMLDSLHRHMRNQGDQDFPTAVLAKALSVLGRDEDAKTLLEQYFSHHRREEMAPIPSLGRIVSQLAGATSALGEGCLGDALRPPSI
jgi:hypothetical protein